MYTQGKYKGLDALKTYLESRTKKEYSNVMRQAQNDNNFRNMIKDMTLGEATGKSRLAKNKYNF